MLLRLCLSVHLVCFSFAGLFLLTLLLPPVFAWFCYVLCQSSDEQKTSMSVRLMYLLCVLVILLFLVFFFFTCDCNAASPWNLTCVNVFLKARSVFVSSPAAFLRCLFICNIRCPFCPCKRLARISSFCADGS